MPPRIVAIVPMRHNSERVSGKNYRMFAGRPLFHYVIENLLACQEIDEVVIDTDSPVISADTKTSFPTVKVLERPNHLRDGSIPMNDVLFHTTTQIVADYYLQTHSTNPLLTSETISRAIKIFLNNLEKNDSLFSVKRLQARLWSADGQPINHDPGKLLRTQDLPPVYEENSCVYIFSLETLQKGGSRIGVKPLLFEMDPIESLDIDEEVDFQIAEMFFLNKDKLGVCNK